MAEENDLPNTDSAGEANKPAVPPAAISQPPETAPDQTALDALAAVQAAIAAATSGNMGGFSPATVQDDDDPVAAAMLEAMASSEAEASDTNAATRQVGHSIGASASIAAAAGGASPLAFTLPTFGTGFKAQLPETISLLSDVNLNVKIELGRTRMLIEDVLKLTEGAVVELDKLAGDPVDVYVNDRPVARGEVLVLNDNFCVRINEIIDSSLLDRR